MKKVGSQKTYRLVNLLIDLGHNIEMSEINFSLNLNLEYSSFVSISNTSCWTKQG